MDGLTRYRNAEQRLWASLGVRPVERFVDVPAIGSRIRVQETGDPADPPVLFLHGANTAGTSFASLAAVLSGRRCLLVDRPGTGLSEPSPNPPRDARALNALAGVLLPAVLDALVVDRADVVATSLGGLFAFRGAVAAPGRVGGIVELGWTPAAGPGTSPPFMRLGSLPGVGHVLAALPANDATVRRLFGQIGLRDAVAQGRVSPEAIAAYAALLNHTPTMRHELALGRAVVSPRRGVDPRLALTDEERTSLRAPVLVVWGTGDPFGGLDTARAFVAGLPGARLVAVPFAGHAPWMDDATSTGALVDAFLRGVASPRAPRTRS